MPSSFLLPGRGPQRAVMLKATRQEHPPCAPSRTSHPVSGRGSRRGSCRPSSHPSGPQRRTSPSSLSSSHTSPLLGLVGPILGHRQAEIHCPHPLPSWSCGRWVWVLAGVARQLPGAVGCVHGVAACPLPLHRLMGFAVATQGSATSPVRVVCGQRKLLSWHKLPMATEGRWVAGLGKGYLCLPGA